MIKFMHGLVNVTIGMVVSTKVSWSILIQSGDSPWVCNYCLLTCLKRENIFISIHLSHFNEKTNLGKCSSWFFERRMGFIFWILFPSSLGVLFDFYK